VFPARQDILAPNKFTKNCDCVAVSEELLAEGMVGHPPRHPHSKDLVRLEQTFLPFVFVFVFLPSRRPLPGEAISTTRSR
jgi:hypothetical protein